MKAELSEALLGNAPGSLPELVLGPAVLGRFAPELTGATRSLNELLTPSVAAAEAVYAGCTELAEGCPPPIRVKSVAGIMGPDRSELEPIVVLFTALAC
ncbi:MAG TPA: hypothetical protein DDW52_26075 [Planctomycetaceae bacterium]|nr:hypothetical protein [Planctomycetaceae bacterium]